MAFPICNFYDSVRILKSYLTQNKKGKIIISPVPSCLAQLNPLIRLYEQEGKFVKICLLNQYNQNIVNGCLDCYLEHMEKYFKKLSEN